MSTLLLFLSERGFKISRTLHYRRRGVGGSRRRGGPASRGNSARHVHRCAMPQVVSNPRTARAAITEQPLAPSHRSRLWPYFTSMIYTYCVEHEVVHGDKCPFWMSQHPCTVPTTLRMNKRIRGQTVRQAELLKLRASPGIEVNEGRENKSSISPTSFY